MQRLRLGRRRDTDLVVRGAPAIGVSASFGLALAALQSKADTKGELISDLRKASPVNTLDKPRMKASNPE